MSGNTSVQTIDLPVQRNLSVLPAIAAMLSLDQPVQAGCSTGVVSLIDCRGPESEFVRLVDETACQRAVEPRALAVRALLHLPRVARDTGQLTLRQIQQVLDSCADQLLTDQAELKPLAPERTFKVTDLRFVADYSSSNANDIFDHLHYLRSARTEALNYALVDPIDGRPVSLCSVSPLQWRRVGRQIAAQFETPMRAVWDISRVYSFDVAPVNAISYLLARVRSDIRRRIPEAQLLTTAVDPNLGFTGVSYLAANWRRWLTIKARPYLYLDERYISPRQLRAKFGTANVSELQLMHGEAFQRSETPLLDSSIFCCRIRGKTEFVPLDQQRRLYR